MPPFRFIPFFAISALLGACTFEHAEEQVIAWHANGIKKTSIWVYPDGEIQKRNEWYSDGIKELEIPYKNNEPNGKFKRWTGFGDLVMEGEYKKGLRHGKWTSYYGGHFNKKKESIRYYRDDHAVGDWEGWHHNGEKAFEEHYNDKGDSVGTWEKWNDSGILIEENSCHSIDSAGSIVRYYDNGKRQYSVTCRHGKFYGDEKEYTGDKYNEVIATTHYKDGVLDGPRIKFIPGTSEAQHRLFPYRSEFWRDGVRDSVWRLEDGKGNLVRESKFVNGTGIAYGQCENNLALVCAETSFVANIPGSTLDSTSLGTEPTDATLWFTRQGHSLRYEEIWTNGEIAESRSYYPDTVKVKPDTVKTGGTVNEDANSAQIADRDTVVYRRLASQGFWALDPNDQQNKRNGIWRNWYPSGILRDSLSYVNGERVGEQFSYDSTGKLTIHKTENGKNRPVIMHIPQ